MADLKTLERIHKAVANRRRLAIIANIKKEKEMPVGKIAARIKLSLKSTSRHLAVLFSANVVEKNQRSTEVFYRLAAPVDPVILETLRRL